MKPLLEKRKPTIFPQRPVRIGLCGALVAMAVVAWASPGAPAREDDAARSRQAFLDAMPVFQHPRCVNCHPAGDVPLQFDESIVHLQRVRRGADGKGVAGMKCSSCHTDTNMPGEHMPPGAPNWHLPPPETPMVFQDLSAGELAKQLKDPQQNGGKTLAQILEHIRSDPLVLWGWQPGDGRSVPTMSHAEFVDKIKTWIDHGAVEPR